MLHSLSCSRSYLENTDAAQEDQQDEKILEELDLQQSIRSIIKQPITADHKTKHLHTSKWEKGVGITHTLYRINDVWQCA